jgi:hypothetical protein
MNTSRPAKPKGQKTAPQGLLEDADIKHLQRWIDLSGLVRVARIAAVLTRDRRRGNAAKPDDDLYLQMACRMQMHPTQTTHATAKEIAHENYLRRKPGIEEASLAKELERGFSRDRNRWFLLARRMAETPEATSESNLRRPASVAEWRALANIIDSLPTAIDLFDDAVAEAKRLRPETVALLKRVGREKVQILLAEALKRQQASPSGIARTMVDLIRFELTECAEAKRNPRAPRSTVGRKTSI